MSTHNIRFRAQWVLISSASLTCFHTVIKKKYQYLRTEKVILSRTTGLDIFTLYHTKTSKFYFLLIGL